MRTFEQTVSLYDKLYRECDYQSSPTPTQRLALNSHPHLKKANVQTILDIGCGRGDLLYAWEERGYVVAGTEIVPSLLAGPLTVFSEIYPYSVMDLDKFADESWDVVTLVDVLDHLQTKDELASALANAFRIARLAVIITVNSVPASEARSVKWTDQRWMDVIVPFAPEGRLRHSSRNGDVFLVWKEFDVRSSFSSGDKPEGSADVPPDAGTDSREEQPGATRDVPRDAREHESAD